MLEKDHFSKRFHLPRMRIPFGVHGQPGRPEQKEKPGPYILLVPYDGSDESRYALDFAADRAKIIDGKVYPVFVIEVDFKNYLDAEMTEEASKGEQLEEEAENFLKEKGVHFQTGSTLQSRNAGPAIVKEIEEQKVSEIVIGDKFKEDSIEFGLGHLAKHILKHAVCEVVLLRLPLDHPHVS